MPVSGLEQCSVLTDTIILHETKPVPDLHNR